VPAGWRVEAAPDQRALLPVLVDLLRTEGLPPQPVFVALLPDTGSAVAPNVLAYELPRSPDSSAIGTLRTLRAAAGTRVLAGEPASEPSRLGDAAYVTYQWTANGASIISEHYAFVRPTAILLVTMTTTVERAQVDGRVFGRVLGSLAAES
jgi:hypothetical protein